MTLTEIEARLAAIATELETADAERVAALETEVNDLIAERKSINDRIALRSRIAAGSIGTPAAPAAAEETVEQREERAFADYIFGRVAEMRTNTPQNFDMGNNAGALVPTTIANRIISAVKDVCPILRDAEIYNVKGTLKIPVYGPKADADSNQHDITVAYATEFVDLTADSGAFTSVDLGGYLIGALTLVSKSLANNSAVDVVAFVVQKIAEKIAIFVEGELLKGSGSANNHCTGALATTNTLNAGSTSAITADKLIELQAKVPQAYQAGACWTMAPATWTAVKKLKYGDGQYLVSSDFSLEFPYRLLGKPVYLSDNMPAIASAAKAVLYGDYKGLGVNIRENVSVEILREKYATQHALGVVAFMELDSKVIDAQKLAALVMSV